MCLTKEFDLTLPRLHVFMTNCPKILRNISNSNNAALSFPVSQPKIKNCPKLHHWQLCWV